MRKMSSVALLMCMVTLLPMLLMPAAHATQPTLASGTWLWVSPAHIFDVIVADGNLITIYVNGGFLFLGDFEGYYWVDCLWVLHPSGQSNYIGQTWFDGKVTVDGAEFTGTLLFREVGTADAGGVQGEWIILSVTGDLANLRGRGTYEGTSTIGTYSWRIHFEPG